MNNNIILLQKNKVFCPVKNENTNCAISCSTNNICTVDIDKRIECSNHVDCTSLYSLIPSDSFLYHFVKYVNEVTDAPDAFALGAGIVMMSSLMRKNVYLPWGSKRLYPNLYLLLLAESGGRKSTTIDIAISMLKRFEDVMLPNEMSPEVMFELLSRRAFGLMVNHEFGGFREMLDRSYMKGAKEFITQLYDSSYIKRAIKGKEGTGEEYTIEEPAVSLITASTMAWVQSSISESDIQSGFMQRFTLIKSKQDKPDKPFPPFVEIPNNLLVKLGNIYKITAEIQISESAKKEYEQFYKSNEEFTKRRSVIYGTFHTRLYTLIWKLAMMYSVMANRITIEIADIKYAITAKLYLEKSLYAVFSELSKSKSAQILEKIVAVLYEAGGEMTRERLIRVIRLTSRELDEYVRTLSESGRITVNTSKVSGNKKLLTVYKLVTT